MLEVKNITKIYQGEGLKQKALDNVSVNFRKCEFASILGPSGSGKTTFLNIIGGLDHYTQGDLIINGVSTKKYKDADWDSYRNHRIGFIFQSYNLISHQTILRNVMLALTLSGISKKESIRRAKKALTDVGLGTHINKRPSQLSGGQMQRVAIARALVNDPEILLADEPTGALDSETSIQIMKLLKEIAKDRLVIMVTHNPDLAKEYSNRIITIKDGKITHDTNPYNGAGETVETAEVSRRKRRKTKMSFWTALGLSANNLLTKKGRTVLVAFAGSIGIIGIALILALSNGFQNYIDEIQEETLTSYPLSISQESADITGALLSMTGGDGSSDGSDVVVEQQFVTSMLDSLSANDLKSFKNYLEEHYSEAENDISTIKYSYSIDPLIYTEDVTGKIAKLNPSNLFTSFYGSSALTGSFSSMASIFSQMIDNQETLSSSYDVLAGRWPSNYNEMVIVLSEPNSIPDLLVYSLGLRDGEELTKIVSSIMSGDPIDIKHDSLKFTYNDLLNIKMKLVLPVDTYKYNSQYNVYEDLSDNTDFMRELYNKSADLKIVGVVTAKEGVTTMALSPGVAYTSGLIKHIINESGKTEIVKKQLSNPEIDVFSGNRFDEKKSPAENLNFADLISVDTEKLQSAFKINVDQNTIASETAGYMAEIRNSITANITPAKTDFVNGLTTLIAALPSEPYAPEDIGGIVLSVIGSDDAKNILQNLEIKYLIPQKAFKETYTYLLSGLLVARLGGIEDELFLATPDVADGIDQLATGMTEAVMKRDILTKVGELTGSLTKSFANAFSIDESKIASSFKLSITEEEITRIVTAMMSKDDATANSNLISLGYQDLESPTRISFYFNSFDNKEHFLSFLDSYNDSMESSGEENKVINYSDTTGILMGSVKTIVNAVSYVLIGFVSVSLVVSSIMIGIITYISVYERTKEIGILRAIGASKRNISNIFNAETFIVGLLSGVFGLAISFGLIVIINIILKSLIGNIPLHAVLTMDNAIALGILSVILTLIGGLIPAKSASRKDPVEALRSE